MVSIQYWRDLLLAGTALALLALTPAAAQSAGATSFVADVEAWEQWLFQTHPDPGYTMDLDALKAAFQRLRQIDPEPTTARARWLAMAQINPLFNDAHVGLRLPDALYERSLADGAAAFPHPVNIADGRIHIASGDGAEIASINGVASDQILAGLLPRVRGETQALRERVLSLRFPIALWTLLGDQAEFQIVLREQPDERPTQGSPSAQREPAQQAPFRLRYANDAAVMTIDSFDIALHEPFRSFVDQSFAEIAKRKSQRLLIDLRRNGGGARDLSDHLMAYLIDREYSPISAVTARIVAENQALVPNSEIGQVVSMPFRQTVSPPQTLPNRFAGSVAIMIGPGTYSQAIVFAATAADHDVATLIGTETGGRANQTGQVKRFSLPHSGFEVQAPIYVFTRASGEAGSGPLLPHIALSGSGPAQLDAAMAADW